MVAYRPVAAGLALATIAAAIGIATKPRAEPRIVTPVRSWMHYVTERAGDTVQHITTAYYLGLNPVEALQRCHDDAGHVRFAHDLEAQLVRDKQLHARDQNRFVIEPTCSLDKPASWIDRP